MSGGWLAALERQPERGHLFAIAHEQHAADQPRVVPRLPLDCLESCELRELVGGCLDQRELTFLRQHEQQVLVRQQHELTVAVAAALPLGCTVGQIDTGQNGAVEAERMAFVNDEVVEVRLQSSRRPALFDGPSPWSAGDRKTANAGASGHDDGVDEDAAVWSQGWLNDGRALYLPLMLPQHSPGRRRNARRAGSAEQQDLRHSIDRRPMGRAVAPEVARTDPPQFARSEVVACQRSR